MDINEGAAKATLEEIKALHGQGMAMNADVADNKQVNTLVRRILDECGKIDILVNNAGVSLLERFIDGAEEAWDKIIDVNLEGTIFFSHAVLGV